MVELTKQEFHTYSPLRDGKPLFPRYIFAKFDVEAGKWGAIKSTRGCVDVLRSGSKPSPIRTDIIEAIMAYEPPAEPVQADPEFKRDQVVRITKGPLAGLEGLFSGSDRKRVQALLEIMGKKVSVPIRDIEGVK